MNKFLLCALVFFFSSFSAPKVKTKIVFKLGSELVYDVDANNEKFELKISLVKIKSGVVFSYAANGAVKKKGVITITPRDMDSGRTLYNDFSGGIKKLNDAVSLFVSRTVYAELATAGMNDNGTTFKPSPTEALDVFTKGEPVTDEVKVNGHVMQLDAERFYDYVDEKHGNYHYSFTVLKNENYPLIMEMNIGWILHLKQMSGVELVEEE